MEIWGVPVLSGRDLEELHSSVDGAGQDQAVAHIERQERLVELRAVHAVSPAPEPEVSCQGEEEADNNELHHQGDSQKSPSQLLLIIRQGLISYLSRLVSDCSR